MTNVNDTNGKSILLGKNCTGFSNHEEEAYLGVEVSLYLRFSLISY